MNATSCSRGAILPVLLLAAISCHRGLANRLTIYPYVQEPPAAGAPDPPSVVYHMPALLPGTCRPSYHLSSASHAGTIVLAFVVGADGKLTSDSVGLAYASDTGLIRDAAAMMFTCRFLPGLRNGQPIAVRVQQPVNFGPSPAASAGRAAILNARAEESGCSTVDYPPALRDSGIAGVVLLDFRIDSTGAVNPGSIQVVSASTPQLVPAAVAAVRGCRFRPGPAGRVQMPVAYGVAW